MLGSKTFLVALCYITVLASCTQYVVLPKQRKNKAACASTAKFLQDYLQHKNVETISSEILGITQSWLIDAKQDQVAEILKEPNVLDVVENKDITVNTLDPVNATSPESDLILSRLNNSDAEEKAVDRVIHNKNAAKDLATVSWRPGKNMPRGGSHAGYFYESAYGRATYVYLIDNGIDPDLIDFHGKNVEWIYITSATKFPGDSDPDYHGSCVLSKATGNIHGVSPNTRNLVIIKTSQNLIDNQNAFFRALEDIVLKRRQSQSVILYARTSIQTYQPRSPLPNWWATTKETIADVLDIGVPVVTTAGPLDGPPRTPINTVPALWAAELPLIIVGASDVSGVNYAREQYLPDAPSNAAIVYAPGQEIRCAGRGNTEVIRRGTSSAAGMVAGLMAYMPNQPQRPDDVRSQLIVNYTRRVVSGLKGPRVIWNGFGRNKDPDPDLIWPWLTNSSLHIGSILEQ